MRREFWLTALLGFAAVVLGALGAHGPVHDVVVSHDRLANWMTAVQYHQLHAVALLVLATARCVSVQASFLISQFAFVLGILLFSGSLYMLAWTGQTGWGAVTPFGGLAFMIGWLALPWGWRKASHA